MNFELMSSNEFQNDPLVSLGTPVYRWPGTPVYRWAGSLEVEGPKDCQGAP